MRTLLALLISICNVALAQPDFFQPREDDQPLAEHTKRTIHEKNLNVGVVDIMNVPLAEGELALRVYTATGGVQVRGGYPMTMWELLRQKQSFSLMQYATCAGAGDKSKNSPTLLWSAIRQHDFLNIQDSRNSPDRPGVRDGIVHIVQIRSSDAYREFWFDDPQYIDSDDSRRLQSVLETAAEVLGVPSCYLDLLENAPL